MAKFSKYTLESGVITVQRTKLKRFFAGMATSLGILGALVMPAAFAAGNSTAGLDRYNDNPGRQQAVEVGAQCGSGAGSGAFGYLGQDNNEAGGADGTQTGLNNSAVCGNRQSE